MEQVGFFLHDMGKLWFHNYYIFHQIKGTNVFEMSLCSLNKCFNRSVFLVHSIFVKISVYCLQFGNFLSFLLFIETQKIKSVIFYTLSCCSKPVWLLNFKILYCSMLYCSCKDYFMVLFFYYWTSIVWKRAARTFFKITPFVFHQCHTALEQHEVKMRIYISNLEFLGELFL